MKEKELNKVIKFKSLGLGSLLGLIFISFFILFVETIKTHSQSNESFRTGEKLTYNISFEKFSNVAYAETEVISKGKLEGNEAFELSAKIKSVDLVSAAFFLVDEKRTTFVAAETGFPLYTRKISNSNVLPKETISNFLNSPTSNFDILSLIFKIRHSGGFGTFLLEENGKVQNVSVQNIGAEKFSNLVGNYETNISSVQSEFLTELGITNLKINFTQDEQRIPVLIRFSTSKGEIRAEIASIQIKEKAENGETPTPTPTPIPTRTQTPTPTPIPYLENQPLTERLPFVLGEQLEYQVSKGQEKIGEVVVLVKERKIFLGKDSLLLQAFVKESQTKSDSIFGSTDKINTQVDPVSLMPAFSDLQFSKTFSVYNQQVNFDQEKGLAVVSGKRIEIPVGTHNILSLAYALRSFNLKPSKDANNPVNDTRVAVFLGTEAFVFSLRPTDSEITVQNGNKIKTHLITVKTGNPNIDKLNLSIWLGVDKNRTPLRFTAGGYQADLVSSKITSPKKLF